ncbi:MAG: hypothetical protein JW902_09580 [Syntrophaceae bacterium]|nr:hypothetical protein [Syntrophaceae bacterium]
MARKNRQQFIKQQKEMERARKAKEKMAKRQGKNESVANESDFPESSDQPTVSES